MQRYLDVSYSPARKPYTNYPHQLARWLLEQVYLKPGTLLDVGCGRGEHLRAFAALGFDVTGIDISPRAPALTPEHQVLVVDIQREELPFPAGAFDFVFSKSVLEHLREPDQMLSKSWQMLKPNGIAVFMTPSWRHVYHSYYEDYTHVTPFMANSLRMALEINDFADVQVSYFRQLPFLWHRPYLLPLVRLLACCPLPYRPLASAPWPESWNTLIRFAKEVMLLGVGRRPSDSERCPLTQEWR